MLPNGPTCPAKMALYNFKKIMVVPTSKVLFMIRTATRVDAPQIEMCGDQCSVANVVVYRCFSRASGHVLASATELKGPVR